MGKFEPIDEKEYKARNTWPAGWYSATISDAPDGCTERMSNSGNMMFETKIQVFNEDGKMRLITAYILAEGKAAFQLRSAAEAFGVLDEYRAGTLTEDDLKGKSGYVKLGIQIDKDGVYPDKNVIADYKKTMPGTVKAEDIKKPKPQTKKQTEDDLSDNIPF